jgi:hypothetical protein
MSDFKIVKLLGNPVSINFPGNINYTGEYDNLTAYNTGDAVSYNGSSYVAIGSTTGNLPTDIAFWQLLAEKGDTGATGPIGPAGPPGASTFTALTDVPNSYVGQSLKTVRVNSGETGLEFTTSVDTDERVKVSANDTTAKYLEDAITVSHGTNASTVLAKTTLNDGGDEDLQIQFDVSKVDLSAANNTTSDFASKAYADAKVADAINDGTTTIAPSQNAVFDALATKQPLDATLTALAAYNTNGILTQTAADTFTGRTITAGAGISVTDGNGVAGNPTISSTITQYTDEQAQDAVGNILTDTASIDFTYNDAGDQITAVVLPAGVDHNSLANLTTGDPHTQYHNDARGDVRYYTKTQLNAGQLNNIYYTETEVDTLLLAKEDTANKGIAGGYASLDGAGKVPVSQLPTTVFLYQGTWDASTNTPTLSDGTGTLDFMYKVSVAGTQNLGSGPLTFAIGDEVIHNGTIWQLVPSNDSVTSVNGAIGAVVLTTTNISEGSNQYFTNERAQDAVGNILTDTASIDFTYNDGANTISADVLPGGVDHNSLMNYVANQHVDHSTVSITGGAGLTGGGDITANRTISMPNVGTPSTYGSASQVPVFTTDTQGRVSAVTNTAISVTSSSITDFNEAAQDAVGNILTDSGRIDFTYNDAGNTITADIISGSITDTYIGSGVDATKIANGSVSNIEFQYLDGVTSSIQTQLDAKEVLSNKATDFTVLNNTLYPTTQAVQVAINTAILTSPIYMLSGTNSDISGYESAVPLALYVSGGLATTSQTVTTTETLLEEFATGVGYPSATAIPVGLISAHWQTEKTSGPQSYYSYFKLYKRSSGGTETLLLTSGSSSETALNTTQQVNIVAYNSTIIPLLTTDRLVMKVYAIMVSGSATITLRWDDATDARFQLPGSSISYVPEDVANKSTDGTLAANSTTLYPSQSAVKTYADTKLTKSGDTITGDIANTSTGYFQLSSGTTAQRPGSPVNSMVRYNTTTGRHEFYESSAWRNQARLAGDTFTGAVIPSVASLTDAATIATDATLGNQFTVTLTASRTLGNPTGAVNGQLLMFVVRQNGTGGWSLTPDTKFRFGDNITSFADLNTTANKTTYILARYHSTDDKFDVIAFQPGY